MKANHLVLKLGVAAFAIGCGAAFVAACSSSSNPTPATGEDGSASSSGSSSGPASSSGSSSGTTSSSGSSSGTTSSGAGSSGSSSGSASTCTPDGGDAATCNSCAVSFCAADAGSSCLGDPYNACSPYGGCVQFTGTVPSHPTLQ